MGGKGMGIFWAIMVMGGGIKCCVSEIPKKKRGEMTWVITIFYKQNISHIPYSSACCSLYHCNKENSGTY
jgi:hypothetical protein